MKKIAISSTVPIEVLYAAGYRVYDLNNLFISTDNSESLLEIAHTAGFQRTTCSWTKGVFGAARRFNFSEVVNVVSGDCSNNHAMGEILKLRGVKIIPFFYPYEPDKDSLKTSVDSFMKNFDVSHSEVYSAFEKLQEIRNLLVKIDHMAFEYGKVTGDELLSFLISGSDMRGDPDKFKGEIENFLIEASQRRSKNGLRIGVIGIPPIFSDLFKFLEELGVQIVYIETAKEFGRAGIFNDFWETYLKYSYPYSLNYRILRIKEEIRKKEIAGLIHYTQSFCFHRNEHGVIAKSLDIPLLRLEGDVPGKLDESTRVRVETFIKNFKVNSPLKHESYSNIFLAVDAGSRNVKIAYMRGEKVDFAVMDTIKFIKEFILTSENKEVSIDEIIMKFWGETPSKVLSATTGYGRHRISWDNVEVISEVEAHFRGVREEFPELKDYTILDIGGQDTKVIRIRDGKIKDFIMNDKCAAGGGRYLENMSRILEIPIEEMGNYFNDPEKLDITCATFGETELVGKMIQGVPIERLAAGVNWSVFKRSFFFVKRLFSPVLVLSGGVARNRTVFRFFKESGEFEKVLVVNEPHLTGVKGLISFLREKEKIIW